MPTVFHHLLSESFVLHRHCYLWKPELVWLNVISDGLIALAYYYIYSLHQPGISTLL